MMKKLLLATLLILGCAFAAQAQLPSTDAYGGRTDVVCADQTKSYFHLEKLTVAGKLQWFFCTPVIPTATGTLKVNTVSHAMDAMSVGGIGPSFITNPLYDAAGRNAFGVIATKYAIPGDTGGTNYNWAWQNELRLQHVFFNTIGQDNGSQTLPYATCTFGTNGCNWPTGKNPAAMPVILESRPFQGSLQNDLGLFTSPPKDLVAGTNLNWTGYRGGTVPDTFDTQIYTELQTLLGRTDPSDTAVHTSSGWVLGVLTDDSDWYECSGAGPDFVALGRKTQIRCSWTTLLTSPVQDYNPYTTSGHKRFLYTSQDVPSKMQALNPVTACSVSNPCSLRDYLWQKYPATGTEPACAGTNHGIAALNACWGSSYTTFDSTGTQITAEQPTGWTGDGTTTVFSGTLANHPISPLSVIISVGGVPKIGGCPWFYQGTGSPFCKEGGSNLPTNFGVLQGSVTGYIIETQAASFIHYDTGAIQITFAVAPASGAAITVSYISGGWMAGGTGLMDEDGSTGGTGHNSATWVGTNPYCLEGANPSYPTYFACTGGGGDFNVANNANLNLGADLDAWEAQHTAEYFKNCQAKIRAVSNVPYIGLDTVGAWGTGPYRHFIEGEVPYVDAMFLDSEQQYSSQGAPEFASQYQYLTQYAGDKPFISYFDITAQPSSSMFPLPSGSSIDMPSIAARGTAYYNSLNYQYSTLSFNGDIQVVGSAWWSFGIQTGAESGLVDMHDNMYDGAETASGAVPCDSYYTVNTGVTCGGEITLSIIPGWTSGFTVQKGSCLQPSVANGHAYCNLSTAHATGTTEPTWCVTSGCTVVDNTMTLTETAVPATPLGDMMSGPTGVIAANQLWLGGTAPPTFPIRPGRRGVIWLGN